MFSRLLGNALTRRKAKNFSCSNATCKFHKFSNATCNKLAERGWQPESSTKV
jgi:hypothetical protein